MSDNTTITDSDNSITSSATPDQAALIGTLNIVFFSISLFAATIGVLVFLYIRLKHPRLADRVTFRLAFAGMVSEVLYAIFQIVLMHQLNPTPLCGFIVWGWVFFSLTSLFFHTCIAIVSNIFYIIISQHTV